MRRRYEIRDDQWDQIKDLLPPERKRQGGRIAKDNRMMLNACFGSLEAERHGETSLNITAHGKRCTLVSVAGRWREYGMKF